MSIANSAFKEPFEKMKEILDSKDSQVATLSASLEAALSLIKDKNAQIDSCTASMQDAITLLAEYKKSDQCYYAMMTYMLEEGRNQEPLEFLRCWRMGNFHTLREEWPDAPKEIYYADPLNEES